MMYRFATNPLQWYADDAGGLDPALAPPRAELFQRVADAGFRAVHTGASVVADVAAYEADLNTAGIVAAPGYFAFDLASGDVSALFEAVDAYAAAHVRLGVSEVYLAGKNVPARIARPVVGVDADSERDELIARNTTEIARRFREGGVRACFHQHIGTWVETEDEIRRLVDSTPDDVLYLGPDTGHLTWAGIDPVGFVSEHRERVMTMHMKDVHQDRLATATGSYGEMVLHGILTEPGRGQVDNIGVLEALPEGFDGWVVIEVDRPDGLSPEASARLSAEWAAVQLKD